MRKSSDDLCPSGDMYDLLASGHKPLSPESRHRYIYIFSFKPRPLVHLSHRRAVRYSPISHAITQALTARACRQGKTSCEGRRERAFDPRMYVTSVKSCGCDLNE